MLAHLIISIFFGFCATLIGAVSGLGGWVLLLCYVGGSWIGFLFSVAAVALLHHPLAKEQPNRIRPFPR